MYINKWYLINYLFGLGIFFFSSLTHVKKRIIEHLSVVKMKGNLKAPIICFVGPVSVYRFLLF